MRFVDEAVITVRSGKGGRGCVSFRREKFIPRGGPDGGDGGDGGSILLHASPRLHSLYDFRLKRLYEAQNGQPGQGSQCHGRNGTDLVIELPVGSQIYDMTDGKKGDLLCDLSVAGQEVTIAYGGRGGKGNEHFKSSTMRAPRFAQPGEPGEERTLALELKILADCGLLGLPNAGKSTFITCVSAARPKIANYPFTTLTPVLGVMLHDSIPDQRMVIADIPGLVEGAHTGYGLGHRFLKHVERTRFLVHIASIEDIVVDDPWACFSLIDKELELFDPELSCRKQIRVINKIDKAEEPFLSELRQFFQSSGEEVYFISALTGEGVEQVVTRMWECYFSLQPHVPLDRRPMIADVAGSQDEEECADCCEDDFPEIEVVYTRE